MRKNLEPPKYTIEQTETFIDQLVQDHYVGDPTSLEERVEFDKINPIKAYLAGSSEIKRNFIEYLLSEDPTLHLEGRDFFIDDVSATPAQIIRHRLEMWSDLVILGKVINDNEYSHEREAIAEHQLSVMKHLIQDLKSINPKIDEELAVHMVEAFRADFVEYFEDTGRRKELGTAVTK